MRIIAIILLLINTSFAQSITRVQNKVVPDIYQWVRVTATGQGPGRDGTFGFHLKGADYLVAGWEGGSSTHKYVYKSTDSCKTWTQLADAPFTGRHTMATFIDTAFVYVVGGDNFNFANDGVYAKDSYKFDGTTWTTQASDCGIGTRSYLGAALHKGKFYLTGGQTNRYLSEGTFNAVMRSSDSCKHFDSIATHPFNGGNLWGGLVSFHNKLYQICGGLYDDTHLGNRQYTLGVYESTDDGLTWHVVSYFPLGRQYHQTLVFDNKIWVLNGYNGQTGAGAVGNLPDEYYSEDGQNWIKVPTVPFTRVHALTCWTDGVSLFRFGGTTGSNNDLNNEVWKLTKVIK